MRKAIKEKDSELAKRVLKDEKDLHDKKKLLGVYLELKNWGEARHFLNTLPNNTESLRNFKAIQDINIDRLESRVRYKLSTSQKQRLETIAQSDDLDNTGYAKSLLSLLEGMRFTESPLGIVSSGIELRAAPPSVAKIEKPISISPNPAQQKVQFEIPEHYVIRKIVFYDTNGSVAKVLTTDSERIEADISDLHAGLYILKFFDVDNNPKYLTKLFINK